MIDNFNKDAIRLKKNFVRYRCEINQSYIDFGLNYVDCSSINDLFNMDESTIMSCILEICKKIPSCVGNISNVVYMSVLCELLDQIDAEYDIYICCALPTKVSDNSYYTPTYANYMYVSYNNKEYHYFNGLAFSDDYITILKRVKVEV